MVPSTAELCHLVRLTLTINCFFFGENHYLQDHGTAMGSRMAPSYANLFMGKLERKFLLTQDLKPRVWWRFIDDIFAIWTHGEQSLLRFIESLNRHHTTIKFTAYCSAEKVTFLDTTVYFRENSLIGTYLNVKPTDKHRYLRMDSCHPKHCKASILFSQALPDFNEFVLKIVPISREPVSLNNIFSQGVITSSIWKISLKERLIHLGKPVSN